MKKVFCMRGIPGSGKDTYIKSRWGNQTNVTICSADDFFMIDGKYCFDIQKLGEAHKACMSKFLLAVGSDVETVVVNNTNINVWHISPYAAVASVFDYEFEVIEIKAKVEHCAARNVHGVPAYQIGAMAEAMRREVLPPGWKVTHPDLETVDVGDAPNEK